MSWILYVLSPVLIHLILSEGTALLLGNILDGAACTALSAFLILPLGIWMYRRDASLHGAASMKNCVHDSASAAFFCRAVFLLFCFLGGGVLNYFWSRLLVWLRVSSAFSNQAQEALFASAFAAQLLGPGLLVPLAEELIFRGLVYTRMKLRLNVRLSVLLSALLFALYHGNPIQMIYAFPMAILLALLYERSGSLMAPVLFHMGANLAAIFLMM